MQKLNSAEWCLNFWYENNWNLITNLKCRIFYLFQSYEKQIKKNLYHTEHSKNVAGLSALQNSKKKKCRSKETRCRYWSVETMEKCLFYAFFLFFLIYSRIQEHSILPFRYVQVSDKMAMSTIDASLNTLPKHCWRIYVTARFLINLWCREDGL